MGTYPGQRHLVYGEGEDPEKIYRELPFGGGGTLRAPERFFCKGGHTAQDNCI